MLDTLNKLDHEEEMSQKIVANDPEKHDLTTVQAESVHSTESRAKEEGISPIFLAKVRVINDAIAECGMGTCSSLRLRLCAS